MPAEFPRAFEYDRAFKTLLFFRLLIVKAGAGECPPAYVSDGLPPVEIGCLLAWPGEISGSFSMNLTVSRICNFNIHEAV